MVSVPMEKISEALKSTNSKKETLRKTFESLKSHSSSLASFTLQWSDLEQHFDSTQKSLEQRFEELKAKEKQFPHQQLEQQETLSAIRSELKSFCLKMDGVGLRAFIMDRRKDLPASREDVTFALEFAPDPAKLVLDSLQGFYPLKSKKDRGGELGAIRRTCVLLLEGLAVISPEVKAQVKKEAKKLAIDWRQKVRTDSDDQLEALVYLQLLGTYGLASEFDVNELLDLIVSIARRKQAVDLYRLLGFKDKISDFVQKLKNKGKQIDAIKFVYAFEMVDKFPPVPLLDAYLKESKKIAQEVRKKGNNSTQSQNEAIAKETSYLRAIIRCIEDYKLESQYPRESIDKRIEELEKQKPEKKRATAVSASSLGSKGQQKQRQSGNKRPRLTDSNTTSDVATRTIVPNTQINLHPPGLLAEHPSSYMGSSPPSYLGSLARYGLSGTTPSFSSYLSSAAGQSGAGSASLNVGGLFGAGATPVNIGASQSPSVPHLYSSESHLQSSVHDRSREIGGYGLLPLYRSSLYS